MERNCALHGVCLCLLLSLCIRLPFTVSSFLFHSFPTICNAIAIPSWKSKCLSLPQGSGLFLCLPFFITLSKTQVWTFPAGLAQSPIQDVDAEVKRIIASNKRFGHGEKYTNQNETGDEREGVWGRCTMTGQLRLQKDVGGLSYSCRICTFRSVCGTWLNSFCIHDLCKHKYTNSHLHTKSLRARVSSHKDRRALMCCMFYGEKCSPSVFS